MRPLRLSHIVFSLVCAFLFAGTLNSNGQEPDDMTLEENLATPEVPASAHNAIVRHIERLGNTFAKKNIEVKYTRKGEVADIIIPCADIFRANQVELSPESPRILNAFMAILKLPALYKVVIAVHGDDTGSEQYIDSLTDERAAAIYDYYAAKLAETNINVIPYGLGNDEPRASNNSIAGRAANRRIDFYIIPEKQTVSMARAGKL